MHGGQRDEDTPSAAPDDVTPVHAYSARGQRRQPVPHRICLQYSQIKTNTTEWSETAGGNNKQRQRNTPGSYRGSKSRVVHSQVRFHTGDTVKVLTEGDRTRQEHTSTTTRSHLAITGTANSNSTNCAVSYRCQPTVRRNARDGLFGHERPDIVQDQLVDPAVPRTLPQKPPDCSSYHRTCVHPQTCSRT